MRSPQASANRSGSFHFRRLSIRTSHFPPSPFEKRPATTPSKILIGRATNREAKPVLKVNTQQQRRTVTWHPLPYLPIMPTQPVAPATARHDMSVILVTGSYDHEIRFWEAWSGICSRTISRSGESGVRHTLLSRQLFYPHLQVTYNIHTASKPTRNLSRVRNPVSIRSFDLMSCQQQTFVGCRNS